ncbi:hypothetical protein QL093DRAFT_2571734 [Fusarium oxysporum]|nr:hypothetical protein QL093DRAFT_2571734 [Fusarium oxysporum]
MDDEIQDWAFSDSGLAYNTGKPGRAKFKIIRVKPPSSHSLSSKHAVSFAALDTGVTKADFTEQENDWDIKTTSIMELVLVVGECLAENDDRLLSKEYLKSHPRTMNVQSFDSKIHAHLNTMASGFIVQLLGDNAEKRRLFTIVNRQDGLCSLRPLASVKTHGNYKKCYWYSEFFVDNRDTVRKKQAQIIKNNISQFIANTIENSDVPVRPRISQLSVDDRTCASINPTSSLQSLCMSALAVYDETGSPDDLKGLLTASQIARGSPNPCALLNEKEDGYWECIRQLGRGDMNQQDARRLLEAYKKLWPQAMNSLAERILTTDAIIQLNKGLCEGALWHLTEVLPDALYRPLIFQFCEMASRLTFDDDTSLPSAILDAYEMIEGTMGNADSTIASLHLDYPASEQEAPISSARLGSELTETSDLQMARDLVKYKIQADAMISIAPLRSLRDALSRDNDIHAAIVSKFTRRPSDAP